MKVFAILLVPKEGSPILEDGPCGFRPPVAERVHGADPGTQDAGHWDYPWQVGWRGNWRGMVHEYGDAYQRALVLAWKGEALPVGCLIASPFKESGLSWLDTLDCVVKSLRSGAPGPAYWPSELAEAGTLVFLGEDDAILEIH